MTLATARAAAVSLSAATAKTLIQVVPGTKPVRVVEVGISFNSITATDVPVTVDLLRQSTAGTSSSLTLVADQENDSTSVVATALQTFTAEPTAGVVLRSWYVTPIGGLFVVQFPLGREPIASSSRIGLRATSPQGETVIGYVTVDE